ncbi:MAG: cytochrome c biogenesis protein CcsA [Armatimonadaceae bacterium]
MVLGYILLGLALALTVVAAALYIAAQKPNLAKREAWARRCALGATGAIVGASVYLQYLIATHQFQVAYVAEYSAKRSAAWYLFAAFWGGQEGSILLWAFCGAILGAVLTFKAAGKAPKVWPIYSVIQAFLLTLLLVKCPFKLGEGPIPADGRGLNPLLENPWMVIHPPMLFLGFAALMVPFAWCVYGLIFKDWDGWTKAAFPWTLFAFTTLGLGLSLGGYWAYETLGWGGFWGWDPVENSSLVPWLFIMALLHGMAIQNRNGGYKIANFLLGFLPFAFMFYGTFLTRTGLLSDFSVHSFSSLGNDGYAMLLGGVLAATFIPLLLLLFRLPSMPKPPAYDRVLSREFGYFIASAILGIIGLIVAVGMSAPLITKVGFINQLLAKMGMVIDPAKGAAAQPEFYNQGNYPLAIILTVAMAITPYLHWKSTDDREMQKRLIQPYLAAIAISLVMTAAGFLMGIRQPTMVLLFATSVFAFTSNLWLVIPRMKHRESRKGIGGFVAHMGAGMLLAGVACLTTFGQQAERVALLVNRPTEVLGYTLTYKGMTHHAYDRANNALNIEVRKGKYVWNAHPSYYFAPWDGKDTLFANPPAILPSIYNVHKPTDLLNLLPWNNPFPLGDLYIAYSGGPGRMPMMTGMETPPGPNDGFTLGPNEEKVVGDYVFALRALSLDERARKAQQEHEAKGGDPHVSPFKHLPEIYLNALVSVTYKGEKSAVEPRIRLEPTGAYSVPVDIPGPKGRHVKLLLEPPSPEEEPGKAMRFSTLNAEDPLEVVLVDVSTKPLIGMVWWGTLLFTIGGFIAYRRRAREVASMGAPTMTEGEAPAPKATASATRSE